MALPFTAEQFYSVFRTYNETVWPVQVFLLGLALLAVALVLRPRAWTDAAIAAILGILWTWQALAYHLAFFVQINALAYGFAALSLAGAGVFFWQGVIRHRLRFSWQPGTRSIAGALLVIFALVAYPVWSWHAGHVYPAMPTFGLPCPTTLFTLGILAFLTPGYPRSPLVVPTVWCFIGAQAAFLLEVPQDLALLVAGAFGLLLMARRKAPGTAGKPTG